MEKDSNTCKEQSLNVYLEKITSYKKMNSRQKMQVIDTNND